MGNRGQGGTEGVTSEEGWIGEASLPDFQAPRLGLWAEGTILLAARNGGP